MITDILWSPDNDAQLTRLLQALAHNDLAEALLAIEGADPKISQECRWKVEALGAAVKGLLNKPSVFDAVDALQHIMVELEHYRGDWNQYYDAPNYYLSSVLQRKRGLPIMLSLLWILVGIEADILVEGVGMPGHFILRVGGEDGVYVDAFDNGKQLSAEDCQDLVTRISQGKIDWNDQFLAVTPPAQIIERTLRNLMLYHAKHEDQDQLYRTVRFLSALCPEDPTLQLIHARIAEVCGAFETALETYESIVLQFPHASAARRARTQIAELQQKFSTLN